MARMGYATSVCWGAVTSLFLACSGCDPSASSSTPAAGNVTQNPFGTPGGGVPVAETTATVGDRVENANAAARPAAAPAATALSIRLSAGTALPQTGPEGTLMGFSVDYRVLQGRPEPTSKFVLVVSGNGGKSVQQPLILKPEGTVEFFTPRLRPEDGPFSAHIVEIDTGGTQRDISTSVQLL